MSLYGFAGSTLRSNVPLPELAPASDRPRWTFERLDGGYPADARCEWFHHWALPRGGVWLRLGRTDSGYLLRFPELADFSVSVDGACIAAFPDRSTPDDTLRHLLLDQVMPLVLSLSGKLVIHASAVSGPQGALAFAGGTGYGKSTLAASFALNGFALLSDDCLLLEECDGTLFGRALYSGLRLLPDSVDSLFGEAVHSTPMAHYSGKGRLDRAGMPIRFSEESAAISKIFFLGSPEQSDGEPPKIAPLSRRDAFIEFVQFGYLMDVLDPSPIGREFEAIRKAVLRPSFYRLTFARDFASLDAVRECILNDRLIS